LKNERNEAVVASLMQLYGPPRRLVLYDSDLTGFGRSQNLGPIFDIGVTYRLNPLEAVIESLVNVIAEDLSQRQITHRDTVFLNKSINEQAVEYLRKILENDPEILKEIHRKWLNRLAEFLSSLDPEKVSTTAEAIFQVAKEFRLSAPSAVQAISSLVNYDKQEPS